MVRIVSVSGLSHSASISLDHFINEDAECVKVDALPFSEEKGEQRVLLTTSLPAAKPLRTGKKLPVS